MSRELANAVNNIKKTYKCTVCEDRFFPTQEDGVIHFIEEHTDKKLSDVGGVDEQ